MWIEPVFDRTIEDINFALAKIEEWKKQDNPDIYDLKGCMNFNDFNRLEIDLKHLNDILRSYSYSIPEFEAKLWSQLDIPNIADVERLIGGLTNIVSGYGDIEEPTIPATLLDYGKVNDFEELLFKVKKIIAVMESCFKKVGTVKAQQKFFLPIGRG